MLWIVTLIGMSIIYLHRKSKKKTKWQQFREADEYSLPIFSSEEFAKELASLQPKNK